MEGVFNSSYEIFKKKVFDTFLKVPKVNDAMVFNKDEVEVKMNWQVSNDLSVCAEFLKSLITKTSF